MSMRKPETGTVSTDTKLDYALSCIKTQCGMGYRLPVYEAISLEGSAKGPVKMSRLSPSARLRRLKLSLMGP